MGSDLGKDYNHWPTKKEMVVFSGLLCMCIVIKLGMDSIKYICTIEYNLWDKSQRSTSLGWSIFPIKNSLGHLNSYQSEALFLFFHMGSGLGKDHSHWPSKKERVVFGGLLCMCKNADKLVDHLFIHSGIARELFLYIYIYTHTHTLAILFIWHYMGSPICGDGFINQLEWELFG